MELVITSLQYRLSGYGQDMLPVVKAVLSVLALIAQTTSFGWNQAKVTRLMSHRQDKFTLLAAAAQFIFPPDKTIEDND